MARVHSLVFIGIALLASPNSFGQGATGAQAGGASEGSCVVKDSCDSEVSAAVESCNILIKTANAQQASKEMKAKIAECQASAEKQKVACDAKFNAAVKACEAAREAKVREQQEAERKVEIGTQLYEKGAATVEEGQATKATGEQKKEVGEQMIRQAAQNTPPEAYQVKAEGEQLVSRGQALQNTGKQLLNSGQADIADGTKRYEQATNAIANIEGKLNALSANRNKSNLQFDKLKSNLADGNTNAESILGDVVPTSGEGKNKSLPSQAGGSPGDTKGQGGNGGGAGGAGGGASGQSSQNGGQANSSKQSDQPTGGGGGGMPSFPSGGSGSSSSPLSVSQPAQDCSNPTFAASNLTCTCKINPGDSRCTKILAAERQAQAAKKAATMYDGDAGGGKNFPNAPGGYKDQKEKNISQNGQMAQGNGTGLSKGVGSGQGGNGSSASSSEARRQKDAFASRGRGGTYGGGGGGSSGGAGSSTSGKQVNGQIPSTFAKAKVGSRVAMPASLSRADQLRQRMQNQFTNSRRSPAGAIGPDGISGPHTDQFKKIRVRYAEIMGL